MNQLEGEHSALLADAETLIDALGKVADRLRPLGDTSYMNHGEFAERCEGLADYLAAALALLEGRRYGPAFAVLRVGLEHHVFDRLLMLGDKYEARLRGVSGAQYGVFCADLAADRFPAVVSHTYKNGNLLVIGRGLDAGPGRTISFYYSLLSTVDPFIGTKAEQRELSSNFMDVSDREQWAQENEDMRAGRLGWLNLVRNLVLNELLAQDDVTRLQVHYRFLGAFVHPSSDRTARLLRRRVVSDPLRYDHYSSELGLLYIESPRECWRLQSLRGWSDDTPRQVPSGSAGAGGAARARARGRLPLAVGRDHLDRDEVRDDRRDPAPLGAGRGGRQRAATGTHHRRA